MGIVYFLRRSRRTKSEKIEGREVDVKRKGWGWPMVRVGKGGNGNGEEWKKGKWEELQ